MSLIRFFSIILYEFNILGEIILNKESTHFYKLGYLAVLYNKIYNLIN